jgi:hypothetical protein
MKTRLPTASHRRSLTTAKGRNQIGYQGRSPGKLVNIQTEPKRATACTKSLLRAMGTLRRTSVSVPSAPV